MAHKVDSQRVFWSLEEWASESEQLRLWCSDGTNGAEVSSFIEAREQLFTDTGLGHELDLGTPVFGEPADSLLRAFDALLAKIEVHRAAVEIIEDDSMIEVRSAAARLIRLMSGKPD